MPNTPAKKPCQEHSSQGSAIEQGQRNQISSGSTYDNTRQQSLESYSEHQAHNSSGRISTAPTRSTSGRMGSGHSKLESREDAELKGKDLSGSSHQASYATVLARSMTEVDLSEGKSFFRADNSSNTLHHPIMSISTMRSEYQNLRSKDRVILPAYSVSVALMHNIAPAHANDQHPFYWTKFKSDKHLDGAYIRLRESHHGALVLSKNNYRLDTYGQASDLERHRMCRKCSSIAPLPSMSTPLTFCRITEESKGQQYLQVSYGQKMYSSWFGE